MDNFLILSEIPSVEGLSSGSLQAKRVGSLDQGFGQNGAPEN
ncbi:hypothetical protein [Celeribacter naphthalenivorans]|nr:hypothetical protein [Celeribacter naphthalenivorans]